MTKQDAKERRPLVAGLATTKIDRTLEEQFVHAGKTKPPEAPAAEKPEGKGHSQNAVSRSPLTTRIRTDYGTALKRASLERQLNGVTPHTLQDILEEALEPWLRTNGYLK
jgi:hypothetical protein